MNSAQVHTLATRLIAARASQQPLSTADCNALQISTRAAAYAVQDEVWRSTQGTLRPQAWKIGNSSDHAGPVRAAMPEIILHGSRTSAAHFRLIGIECEIAVRFARPLRPRNEAYSREEVLAAVGSAHVAIEIVDTALADPAAAGPLMGLADSMLHGSFVLGETIANWRALDWSQLKAQSFIDDQCVAEKTGGHPHIDPLALLPWWANAGALDWGGVEAGDIITTGTWNGMHFARTPQTFEARFSNAAGKTLGSARVSFAP